MRSLGCLLCFATACAAPAKEARPAAEVGRIATNVVEALIDGDYDRALILADRGLAARPDDPWLLYDKGAALASLGRLDTALETLRQAERRFTDPHNRSLAAYRRALALELAGRCAEASTELSQYAALVERDNPTLASDALAHLKFCVPPSVAEISMRLEHEVLRISSAQQNAQQAEALSNLSVRALIDGDHRSALTLARAGLALAPEDPWLLYNAGAALWGLDDVTAALEALHQAERSFSITNVHGRSVAIYGRAMALEVAGRCEEEAKELGRYAKLVRPDEPDFVRHAVAHFAFCKVANAARPSY